MANECKKCKEECKELYPGGANQANRQQCKNGCAACRRLLRGPVLESQEPEDCTEANPEDCGGGRRQLVKCANCGTRCQGKSGNKRINCIKRCTRNCKN